MRFAGVFGESAFSGSGPSASASVSGFGVGSLYALGGTPTPGLAIAGALVATVTRAPFHGSPHDPEGYATTTDAQLGVMMDWFPNPTSGWHVGAVIGLGILAVTDSWIPDSSGGAFAGTLLGGYDWWIGPQWSLGLLAMVSATSSASMIDDQRTDTGYQLNALFAGIGYALTLH